VALALGVVIVATIFIFFVAALVVAILAGPASDITDSAVAGLSVAIAVETVLVGTAVLFTVARYRLPWQTLGFRLPKRGSWWLPIPVVAAALGIITIYRIITIAIGYDEPQSNLPVGAFDSTASIILLALLSLALAPVIEEVFFRGFVFAGLLKRWGFVWAALASSLLFAIAHFDPEGSFTLLIPIGGIGLLFAWTYLYSGSLFAIVAAHLMFNSISFIASLVGET
jgi:membrane protease YdiL (CAAX protease family)